MSLIKVNQLSTLDGAVEQEVSANTGLKIPSSASLKIEGDLLDSGGSPGQAGQYLITNGTNVLWSSLPQDLDTNADVTFGSLVVEGDVTITGTLNFNLNGFTTDDLVEGSNKYYTNARARLSISATNSGSGDGSISYNSSSGVITYTGPTETDYRGSFSALKYTQNPDVYLGNLIYSSTNGQFTYYGPTVSEIRSQFSGLSNGIDANGLGSFGYDSDTGEFSYQGATPAQIRQLFNANTPQGSNPNGLSYVESTGTFYIDPGAIDPELIYAGINLAPTSTTGNVNDSIQNIHVNNASYQLISITSTQVSGSIGTVSAPNHLFVAGDRIRLEGTGNAHLDGIYNVNNSTPGVSFQVTVSNVPAATYNGGTAKRVSVFTGDLVVDGSINVNGSKIGLSDLFVGTSLIRLNSDLPDTSAPNENGTDDAYIEVNRGSQPDTALRWNESLNRWQFSNDGVNWNNMLLPSETDFGGAAEFGASGDPNRYNPTQAQEVPIAGFTFVDLTFTAGDIAKFKVNQGVKVFGVSTTSDILTSNPPPSPIVTANPSYDGAIYAIDPTDPNSPFAHRYYVYATAQMDMITGDISTPVVQSASPLENIKVDDLNETNYNVVRVSRSNSNKAVLLYRAIYSDDGGTAAANAITNFGSGSQSDFKLIAVIGNRYMEGDLSYDYNDYGSYDVTKNSFRNDDGSYPSSAVVHVPHVATMTPKQGFVTTQIQSVDTVNNKIRLSTTGLNVDSNLSNIFVYHDDTISLQNAINNASSTGRNFLVIPGGTYLITQLTVPDGFTLKGLSDATVLHKQYWDTSNLNSASKNGARGAVVISNKYNATNGVDENDGAKDIFFGEIIIDGNALYQILDVGNELGPNSNDCLLNFINSDYVRLQSVKCRYSAGPALYATGSTNLTIISGIFFDGAQEERFETPTIIAEEGDTTIVSNCIFRDFPGPLIFSSTEVLSINGCTIRNCGSGLRIYGSKKTDVLNNLILGPSDEYIPVPDLYDSEFNSVNISLIQGQSKDTPVYTYLVSGQEIDLTSCVRRIEFFPVTVVDGAEIVDVLNPIIYNGGDLGSTINDFVTVDPSLGQTQFRISSGAVDYLYLNYPTGPNQYNIYRAYAIKYLDIGDDVNPTVISKTLGGGGELVGGEYQIIVNQTAANSVTVGDYIKLKQHSYDPQPPVPGERVWQVSAAPTQLIGETYRLDLVPYYEDSDGNLFVDTNLTQVDVSNDPVGGGYISLRDKFNIAKGVVSITV